MEFYATETKPKLSGGESLPVDQDQPTVETPEEMAPTTPAEAYKRIPPEARLKLRERLRTTVVRTYNAARLAQLEKDLHASRPA